MIQRYPLISGLFLALWSLSAPAQAPVTRVAAPNCQAPATDAAWVNGLVGRVVTNDSLVRGLRAAAGAWMLCSGQVNSREGGYTAGQIRLQWQGGLEVRVKTYSADASDLELVGPGGTLDRLRILVRLAQAMEADQIPIVVPQVLQPDPLGFVRLDSSDSEVPGYLRLEHNTRSEITRVLLHLGP